MTAPENPLTAAAHSNYEKRAARFWNRLADYYFKQPIQDEEAYQKKLEMTQAYFTPKSSILEFGCGTGGTALKHAPFVERVHAIDISSKMIDIATSQAESSDLAVSNVTFECAGIDNFQASQPYDVVLGMSILHLLPNKDQVLQRIHGMVKPGGYFVSSTPCLGDHSAGTFIKFVAPPLSFLGIIPKLTIFTKSELKSSIEKAGFSIEEEFQPGNQKEKAVLIVAKKIT
ncbi:methylase [Nitzschia inconspicua]|uniref:Methylase n=1 Tax=Nitzschia inconspicua TaxID=303405 RepID=A0A9K3KPM7_9STRA|nr:methylase [Nitzschia inconspicua]